MTAAQAPKPGSFGLARAPGRNSWWISLGQALNSDATYYTHAFLVLDNGEIVEGEPGGARLRRLDHYLREADCAYFEPEMTDQQRAQVIRYGRALVGTPYSFLDYLSLALVRLGIRPNWLKHYVESGGHLICSALVDRAYTLGGVTLFTDNRVCGDVTPGDLDRYRLTGEG